MRSTSSVTRWSLAAAGLAACVGLAACGSGSTAAGPAPASTGDGSGTIVIGGTLKDQTRRNPTNLSGSGIEGGQTFQVSKGSYFLIPAGTPHYFASMGPEGLTIVGLHVPKQ